jgi:hypothetical protein
MSYIGNEPLSVAFLTDTFSGNGSTVAFTMSVAPANTSSILVAITGVVQDPSTYSVSGTTLTFSAAPPSGTSNISVRYLGIPASGVTTTAYRTVTDTTATNGQTTFTIPSYTVGYVDVFRNGVRLAAADFTATTGTTIVLVNPASAGDTITTVSFYVSSVLNAIPATNNSVQQTYLASGVAGTGPAFSASLSAGQTITASTFTKVACNSEAWDTASCYDNTTNYRFTPNVAGYYTINFTGSVLASTSLSRVIFSIYKNGNSLGRQVDVSASLGALAMFSGGSLVYFNGSTDYVELYVFLTGTGTLTTGSNDANTTYFQGFLARAA